MRRPDRSRERTTPFLGEIQRLPEQRRVEFNLDALMFTAQRTAVSDEHQLVPCPASHGRRYLDSDGRGPVRRR